MKRFLSLIVIIVITLTFVSFPSISYCTSYAELVVHWSPVIYHDVSTTWSGGVRTDFITNFNYDGDWIGNNNWENLTNYNQYAYVYYSVQETATHYFIGYYFFHPKDDGIISLDRHENDFEGILAVIKKDGSQYGSLIILETQAHGDFYQYTASGSGVTNGHEDIDGTILFDGSHPKIFIEAGGHGVYAYDGSSAPGGDGIVYIYTGAAQYPTAATGNYTNVYGYALLNMDEIWNRRYDTGGSGYTFESFGTFDGDNYQVDSANAPWGWDDGDDGPNFRGMMWSDPAYFIDQHLNGLGTFSHTYVHNPYYTHKITCNSVAAYVNCEGTGMGTPDVYIKVYVNSQYYTDSKMWKKNDVTMYVNNSIWWGYDNAEDYGVFSEAFNTLYICQPHYSQVVVEVYDKDWDDSDTMGNLIAQPVPGETIVWNEAYTSNGYAKFTGSIYANID